MYKKGERKEGDSILPAASHMTTESKEFLEATQLDKYNEFLTGTVLLFVLSIVL